MYFPGKTGGSINGAGERNPSSKRDMKHAVMKTPSSSSFPTPVTPSLSRQQQQPTVAPTSVFVPASQCHWGEVDPSEQLPAPMQPVRPLWSEGWKAKTVVCRVPRLSLTQESNHTEPVEAVASALDVPLDRHGRNHVLHSLDMQRHLQDLRVISSAGKLGTPGNSGDLPPPPPTRYWKQVNKPTFDMLRGSSYKVPSIPLDPPSLHLLLRRATAALCAHTGYEESSSKALDALSDVMGGFLQNLCKVLSTNVEQKSQAGSSGFQDALEQSLYQCGIAGREALHKYWRCSVIGTNQYLERECEKLSEPLLAHHGILPSRSSATTAGGRSLSKHKGTAVDLGLPHSWTMAETDVSSKDEEIVLDALKLDVMKDTMPDIGVPEFPSSEEGVLGEDIGSFSLELMPSRKRSWSTQDNG